MTKMTIHKMNNSPSTINTSNHNLAVVVAADAYSYRRPDMLEAARVTGDDDDSNRSTLTVVTTKKHIQQDCVYGCGDDADDLPQKKSVTFKPTVRARFVLPRAEYTEQELHDCWYTEQDLLAIRKDIDRAVRVYRLRCRIERKNERQQQPEQVSGLAESADDNGDDASSIAAIHGTDHSASLPSSYVHRFHRDGVYTEEIRGIERKTKVGLRMRTRHRMDASRIVCIAQQAQWDLGIYDAEFMAESYIDVTKVCQDDAYRMGLLDELEARRVS